MTLNLMIGLLHPPLGMVLFVLSRVAKLSVEQTTMAILPWLIPLFAALIAITFIPEITLWLPQFMGMIEMTLTAQAATLFGRRGPAHRRRAISDALAPGMVRVRVRRRRHLRLGHALLPPCPHRRFRRPSPLVLGHEIAGTVAALNGDRPGLAVGDRVAVNPSRWCGHCGHCRDGRLNLCENIYFMGSASKTPHMQGGFASLFDAIPAQCVKIPDHVTFEAAALAEPLAVCLHAVARAGDDRKPARPSAPGRSGC